ncbi:hypothetical protein GCM10009759_62420 [Kitasatospora saccharophila]|uniref:Uncharacterized protein n=1 Tax=Kitasatospora saccharophila TaxID=407973 RepID=A0ABP5JG54_9ACTN
MKITTTKSVRLGHEVTRYPCVTRIRTHYLTDPARCATCTTASVSLYRPWEQPRWLCPTCTAAHLQPGQAAPTPTQPGRALRPGEHLRSPDGTWTVTATRHIELPIHGTGSQYTAYLLRRHHDGHQQLSRGTQLAEAGFHLIPAPEQLTFL